MKQKVIFIPFLFLFLLVGFLYFYINKDYVIDANSQSIESSLTEWENRGEEEKVKIKVLDVVTLGNSNTSVVLFELDNKYTGYAQLNKGWNGKYKIKMSGYGTSKVSYVDIKTNSGVYGIIYGENPNKKIAQITAALLNENYSLTFTVSEEETFLKYDKIPDDLTQTFPAETTCFDANHHVIRGI
ncbi:hypothetical protein [Niallia sp. FSL R7-0271]|uniref:hypothetical protein n=1 Tax=Niallia sp. FSL R7-0271 TaxID=2921678 RepID=UPI0030F99E80